MRRFISALALLAPLTVASPPASARPWSDPRPIAVAAPSPVGMQVQVSWAGTFWDATILAARGDAFLIRYNDWSSMWDEWVDASRIRFPRGPAPMVAVRPVEASWVFWDNAWRPGRVIEVRDGWYHVSCDGGVGTWVQAGWIRHGSRPGHAERPPRYDVGEHGGWGHRPDEGRPGGWGHRPDEARPGGWNGQGPGHHEPARPHPSDGGSARPERPQAQPQPQPEAQPRPEAQPQPGQTPGHGARPGGGQPSGGHATPGATPGGQGGGHATPPSSPGGQGGGHATPGGQGHGGHGARPGTGTGSGDAARPTRP